MTVRPFLINSVREVSASSAAIIRLAAGCDILLVCNNPTGADEVLDSLAGYSNPTSQLRMIRLHGDVRQPGLLQSQAWVDACAELARFNQRLGLAESGDLFE